jgi:hypothetical protein
MIKKDVKKRIMILRKLFVDYLDSKDIFEFKDGMEFLRDCEKSKSIKDFEGLIIGIGKVKKDDQLYMRMIFTSKDGGKKTKNIRKIMDLIKDIENALIYIDDISIENLKEKEFICINVLKQI